MPETDIAKVDTTQLDSANLDYQTSYAVVDESMAKETTWHNEYWNEGLGIFHEIPEFKEPIKALARWSVGRGYKTDNSTSVILENIIGWGEDSFQSILTNLLLIKKINGDAYAEIVRSQGGTLINLKVLNPNRMKTVVNQKGMIVRYEEVNAVGQGIRKYKPSEIFHITNDRIANEIHGTPAWKACKWELEAKREAMKDWRRISHRSTIRILYVDMDDQATISTLRTEYKEGIDKGEVLILPAKKGDAELIDYNLPPIDAFIRWIEYLDRRIYQSLGIPKAIADTADFTEAASKIGYMTFEPVYTEEQTLLESDLWNQLALKVKFNRPPSLNGAMQEEESKNAGQTGFQPNDTTATIGRE